MTWDCIIYQCLGPDEFVEDGVLPLFNSFEGLSSVSQLVMNSNGYTDDRKWKCMIYIDDWVGVKIYANEIMGLLDEKGLEAVAMTTRGNLNSKEWLLW